MKLTISKLESYHEIKETIILDHLKLPSDILEINKVDIKGFIRKEKNVYLKLQVSADLVLGCTLSLKPVPYLLEFDLDLTFSNDTDGDYALTPTIDLDQVILGHIILEKPFTIYHPDVL